MNAEQERATIVTWLRQNSALCPGNADGWAASKIFDDIADAIERGDHTKEGEEA